MSTSQSEAPATSPQVDGKKKRRAKDERRDPMESDVYATTEDRHRRVVAVKDGRVCYSVGADMNRWCNLRTFREWMRDAKLIHERTPSTDTPKQESPTA